MNQEHVMSLLRSAQNFFFDAEKHIEKQLNRLPLTEKAKSNLKAELKTVRATPKIAHLPEISEQDLAVLIKHISEDVMAFKEYMESITVFLTTHLVIHETTVKNSAEDFTKQPLYLKPIKCFGASKTILSATIKYKKIYDCLKIFDAMENNLDFLDSELSVFNLDTKDYVHFTRIVNSNLRNIGKESYYCITRVYKALKLEYSTEQLRSDFFVENYYFDKRFNSDTQHILTMLDYFIDAVKKMLDDVNEIEKELNGLLKEKDKEIESKEKEHSDRPLGSRIFYTFTYLETRRRNFAHSTALKYAINFNGLNRHRLIYLTMLLSKTLKDLKEPPEIKA